MKQGTGPDLAVGVAVLGMGLVAGWLTWSVPPTPIYAVVGPSLVPAVVSAGLVALGLGLVLVALRGGWSADMPEVAEAPPTNWRALGLLGAGLVVNLALIDWLGFVIAATVQYVLVTAAFGSRRYLRDLAIGAVVALFAYLGFDRLLGVNIGAGVLEGWL
jgi:putative tricarboxylic transport membrane protein